MSNVNNSRKGDPCVGVDAAAEGASTKRIEPGEQPILSTASGTLVPFHKPGAPWQYFSLFRHFWTFLFSAFWRQSQSQSYQSSPAQSPQATPRTRLLQSFTQFNYGPIVNHCLNSSFGQSYMHNGHNFLSDAWGIEDQRRRRGE